MQKKSSRSAPEPLVAPIAKNECWTLNFVTCELFGGHAIRALLVVDQFTRECPVVGINFQYPSWQVVKTLSAAVAVHGKPRRLRLSTNALSRRQTSTCGPSPRRSSSNSYRPCIHRTA